jgi:hypothetical protein
MPQVNHGLKHAPLATSVALSHVEDINSDGVCAKDFVPALE